MSDIHALSGAYAVDALNEHERVLFERHLAECGDCRDEVRSLREASTTLAEVAAAPPPPALRESVLSGISGVRPLPPAPGRSPAGDRRRQRFAFLVAAAAAVVALIGSALLVAQPWDDDPGPALTAADVVNAPDQQHVRKRFDGATATVYHSAALGRAAVVFDDLPAAPPGQVYELWLQKDGVMVPAGLVPSSGDQEILLAGDATDATAAGITLEPEGGSKEPSLPAKAILPFEQAA